MTLKVVPYRAFPIRFGHEFSKTSENKILIVQIVFDFQAGSQMLPILSQYAYTRIGREK